jgi:hypothetical protein
MAFIIAWKEKNLKKEEERPRLQLPIERDESDKEEAVKEAVKEDGKVDYKL